MTATVASSQEMILKIATTTSLRERLSRQQQQFCSEKGSRDSKRFLQQQRQLPREKDSYDSDNSFFVRNNSDYSNNNFLAKKYSRDNNNSLLARNDSHDKDHSLLVKIIVAIQNFLAKKKIKKKFLYQLRVTQLTTPIYLLELIMPH